MPIYEYQCQKCGQHTEVLQKFSDEPILTCESCSGRMKKLISQSSFHLKGSGWYVTDYAAKNAGSNPAGCSEKQENSSDSDGGAVKSETKTSSESSSEKD